MNRYKVEIVLQPLHRGDSFEVQIYLVIIEEVNQGMFTVFDSIISSERVQVTFIHLSNIMHEQFMHLIQDLFGSIPIQRKGFIIPLFPKEVVFVEPHLWEAFIRVQFQACIEFCDVTSL